MNQVSVRDESSQPGQFVASDGYVLHYRHWVPTGQIPSGFVVALHGIQSHSGWYKYSSQRMSTSGFDVRFVDRRGAGRNDVDRGHAPHCDRLINDVAQFLSALNRERDAVAPNSPVILMGISWGGKLATVCAARRPDLLDGLALLCPGLRTTIRPKYHQRMLLRLAMRFGKHWRRVPIPLADPALFTNEPHWQQFLRDDPLALHEATVGLLSASVALDDEVQTAATEVRTPILLMLAGRDRIIDNAATRRLFDQIPSNDRTLLEYENAAHTLEFEPNRAEIVDDLLEWLRCRSSG